MKDIQRRGLMLVLSSPSGAGKTTLARRLLAEDPDITMSVSVTTRPRRPGEQDGVDYHFVTPETFDTMVAEDKLLEHAKVFGNAYGTPSEPVYDTLHQGRDILFDIDWQGTQQLEEKAPEHLVTVFILPPSTADLEKRLRGRNQDPDDVVAARMAKAGDEMSHWPEYQYVIINHEVEDSLSRIKAILAAERMRRERQVNLSDFVNRLRNDA